MKIDYKTYFKTQVKSRQNNALIPVKGKHRVIAIFFTLIFLQTLIPYNQVWANNNGPKAPEAGAFEPVEASDMVNLTTGDFIYTLPIINVPGSNGGYPLALSYHGGISTDQEASWVGLGWSLNPGSIDRNVNRFPDDWKNETLNEYYWDKGKEYEQKTLGVMVPLPNGITIGGMFSWGSLRGNSGSVSFGYGGAQFTVGSDFTGGLSIGHGGFGASLSSSGIGIQAGGLNIQQGFNGEGTTFSLDVLSPSISNSSNTKGISASLGVSYNTKTAFEGYARLRASASGISKGKYAGSLQASITTGGNYSIGGTINNFKTFGSYGSFSGGSGANQFYSSIDLNEYSQKYSQKGFNLLLVSYKKEELRIWLDKTKPIFTTGSLYKADFTNNQKLKNTFCKDYAQKKSYRIDTKTKKRFFSQLLYDRALKECLNDPTSKDYAYYSYTDIEENYAFNVTEFDDYSVTGQGIAGHISPKLIGNPNMAGYEEGPLEKDYRYYYFNDQVNRSEKTNFYFRSLLSHKSQVNHINYNNSPSSIYNFIVNPSQIVRGNDMTGNYTTYYTYKEIEENELNTNSIIFPSGGTNRPVDVGSDAIAGFAITSMDGMTYHYMRPVYNRLHKIRKVRNEKNPRDAYNESTKPAYATHWMLTAITGSDYFDKNGDNKVNNGDYGYWVEFNYGKWSDGMVWRNPSDLSKEHKKEAYSYMWGIKELYYLDYIKTNTHTAFFIKRTRNDARGVPVPYIDKDSSLDKTLPSEKQLLLDRIIVVKNSNVTSVSKNGKGNLNGTTHTFYDPRSSKNYRMQLSDQRSVLDINDFENPDAKVLIPNSLNEVHFKYDYSLARNAPNSTSNGKLTLKRISSKGFNASTTSPDYQFSYSNNPNWKLDADNSWGYLQDNPTAWTLDKITTPTGAEIRIEHERDEYEVLGGSDITQPALEFNDVHYHKIEENYVEVGAEIGNFDIYVGDTFTMKYSHVIRCHEYDEEVYLVGTLINSYTGKVEVYDSFIRDKKKYIKFKTLEPNKFTSEFIDEQEDIETCEFDEFQRASFKNNQNEPFIKGSSGIRVKSVTLTNGLDSYKTNYEYSLGEIPYEPGYDRYDPRHHLLSSPITLYPKVTVSRLGTDNTYKYQEEYKFSTYSRNDLPYRANKIQIKGEIGLRGGGIIGRVNGNGQLLKGSVTSINDYQSDIGLLKSMTHRTKDGRIIYKEINDYSLEDENSMFTDIESLQIIKRRDRDQSGIEYIMTQHKRFPSILKSKRIIAGNKEQIIKYENFDPYTGLAKTNLSFDANGQIIKSETILARDKYPAMGSKVENSSNKNMLVQEAGNRTWIKSKSENDFKLLSSSIQTWHNQWNLTDYKGKIIDNQSVWRKHKNYFWKDKDASKGLNSDGTIKSVTDATSFSWWNNQEPPQNSGWFKNSEIKRYNQYSQALETEDINGNRVSKKLDINNNRTIAVCDTDYDNFFYAGFEDYSYNIDGLSGQVNRANTRTSNSAHTGRYGLNIAGSWTALADTNYKSGKYKISLWSKSNSLKVNNTQATESVKAGQWYMNNYYLTLSGGQNIVISGSGIIDDFRMHPISSNMISYVYDDRDLVTYIINGNGLAIHYVYNLSGRLVSSEKEIVDNGDISGGFKKVSSNIINYKSTN